MKGFDGALYDNVAMALVPSVAHGVQHLYLLEEAA